MSLFYRSAAKDDVAIIQYRCLSGCDCSLWFVKDDMNSIRSRRNYSSPLFDLAVAHFHLATKFSLWCNAAYPVEIGYICLTTEQIIITAKNNITIFRTDLAYIQGLGARNTKSFSLTYGVMNNPPYDVREFCLAYLQSYPRLTVFLYAILQCSHNRHSAQSTAHCN